MCGSAVFLLVCSPQPGTGWALPHPARAPRIQPQNQNTPIYFSEIKKHQRCTARQFAPSHAPSAPHLPMAHPAGSGLLWAAGQELAGVLHSWLAEAARKGEIRRETEARNDRFQHGQSTQHVSSWGWGGGPLMYNPSGNESCNYYVFAQQYASNYGMCLHPVQLGTERNGPLPLLCFSASNHSTNPLSSQGHQHSSRRKKQAGSQVKNDD